MLVFSSICSLISHTALKQVLVCVIAHFHAHLCCLYCFFGLFSPEIRPVTMSLNKSMHPRNRYKDKPPDFAYLASKYPDFQQHVHTSLTGRPMWVLCRPIYICFILAIGNVFKLLACKYRMSLRTELWMKQQHFWSCPNFTFTTHSVCPNGLWDWAAWTKHKYQILKLWQRWWWW